MTDKSGFEWHSDEEEFVDAGATTSRRPLRYWKRTGFWLILLVVIGIAVSYGLLSRKRMALEADAEREILAGFELWRNAITNDDMELFNLTLSATDRTWRQVQKRLLAKNLILNRSQFGLQVIDAKQGEPIVELSPDLQSATLFYEQEYQSSLPEIVETVRLMHTIKYLKQDDRWLQAPLDEAYWGEWREFQGDNLFVKYLQKDEAVAERISRDLDKQLAEICMRIDQTNHHGLNCSSVEPFTLLMSIDLAVLEEFSYTTASVPHGKKLIFPTPSLFGLPVDENGYERIYQLYARNIIDQFEAYFNLPLPLPDESIYTICFDFPNEGPRLFRFDPLADQWNSVMTGRVFYSLRALPDDSGIIVQEGGLEDDRDRLRLIQYRHGRESLIFDAPAPGNTIRPIGWAESDLEPRFLLQSGDVNRSSVTYSWIDLNSCIVDDCPVVGLQGFPSWSIGGAHTLIVDESYIFLGDAQGDNLQLIGRGFNPFWINHETYGLIRFKEQDEGITTEVAVGEVGDEELVTLVDSEYLGQAAGMENGDRIFIQYVTPIAADPDRLIIAASGLRDLAGEYLIFSYLSPSESLMQTEGGAHLLLRNIGVPEGTPATLTPTGFPPIEISPDGRWLVVSELSSEDKTTRTFNFIDLHNYSSKQLSESYPILPAQFPYYDWSQDGRWLVISERGFIRLMAPEFDYERLVPHEYGTCGFTVWSQ